MRGEVELLVCSKEAALTPTKKTQTKGAPMFELLGIDLFTTEGSVQHISRYVASVRCVVRDEWMMPSACLLLLCPSAPTPHTL